MGIVDSFTETIAFFDSIKKEGFVADYALIGGLALVVRSLTHADRLYIVTSNQLRGYNLEMRKATEQRIA